MTDLLAAAQDAAGQDDETALMADLAALGEAYGRQGLDTIRTGGDDSGWKKRRRVLKPQIAQRIDLAHIQV